MVKVKDSHMRSEVNPQSQRAFPDIEFKMPVLFVGHGSPTNAIEHNVFTRAWVKMIESLPQPKAVLCVSAHWETVGTEVTATDQPETIHDFFGFPDELYQVKYPAPGSPSLAHLVRETVHLSEIRLNNARGLDHGTWSVLCKMFPKADIPVIQLSLDSSREPAFHHALGRELRSLRRKGVLIVGSGNIVHNLRSIVWQDTAYDWALEFDEKIRNLILAGDHQSLIDYQSLGPQARLAAPTNEHYLPLLYVLGLQDPEDEIAFYADQVTLGSISMRSIKIG